jgi:hypothetical protein
MSTLPLPENAQPILQARLKGRKPADMVIVSLIGPVETNNPIVIARPGISYDWRWLRGLDVCLYLNASDDAWGFVATDVAKARPEHLCLWTPADGWGATIYLVPTAQDVHKHVSMWRYELDFLPWLDFQNQDFIEGRRYARNERGMPYATH